jgi:hypothetical protein
MVTAKAIEGSGGGRFDLLNAAGYWVGWVARGEATGELTLMSTGAPLTDSERASLAARAGEAIGERVAP